MRSIYVVGSDLVYANWAQGELVDTMEQADLVLFTGGEDVSPGVYGQPRHPTTCHNPRRDRREASEFEQAVELGKPILGICRGSQFCCAMSGGILVQDQRQSGYLHWVDTWDGQRIRVSSTHHQAQFPWRLPAEDWRLLGWARNESATHEGGLGEELVNGQPALGREVEIALYRKTKALAIQSHPEHLTHDPAHAPMIAYMRRLLDLHMEGAL